MKISNNGLNIIKEFEGYYTKLPDGGCKSYRSQLSPGVYDIWTIGWGCTEGITSSTVWTLAQAEDGLDREVSKFEEAVTGLVKFIPNQNQFDALVSFAYNVGVGGLTKSSVLKYANAGNFEKAAQSFALWNKAQGVTLAGLVSRRAKEASLFMKSGDGKVDDTPTMAKATPVEYSIPSLAKNQTIAASSAVVGLGAIATWLSWFSTPAAAVKVQAAETILQTVVSYLPPTGAAASILSSILGLFVIYHKYTGFQKTAA